MIRPSLLSEARLSLVQLARRERIGLATICRWTDQGIGGIRLETFKIGRRKFTTIQAFERFVGATNGGFSEPIESSVRLEAMPSTAD